LEKRREETPGHTGETRETTGEFANALGRGGLIEGATTH